MMGQTRTIKNIRFHFAAAFLLAAFSMILTFGSATFAAAGKSAGGANAPQVGTIIYAYNATNNHLVSFDAATPGTILTDVAITGVNDFVEGIDFRPSNGRLYAITADDFLYTINVTTGVATQVSATPFTPDIFNEYANGFDFNPVVDRLRVVTTGDLQTTLGLNFRLDPNTGANAGNDGTPTFAAGDPNADAAALLSQLAYNNNVAGATTTTAYAIDFNTDSLTTLGSVNGTPVSPNSGTVFTVGSLGVVTANPYGGFDIQGGTNLAYAALRVSVGGANRSNLYSINLTTGAATLIGRIGTSTTVGLVDGLAIQPAATTPAPARTEYDFDGDKKADASVFRSSPDPANNQWYVLRSATNSFSSQEWGQQGDKLAPADYDGDTKTDYAVFRDNGSNPDLAYFYILNSNGTTFRAEQFGRQGDVLAVGDWDNDGKADPAVYRAGASAGAQSYFFYRPSATAGVNFNVIPWGSFGDTSVRGDFDGDGRADAAVFRSSQGAWYIRNSGNGAVQSILFGSPGDRTVSGDFDFDGKSDLAVFRPSNNVWYIRQSSSSQIQSVQFGLNTDTLVPADYDGDGKTDIAVWRNGLYIILQSTTGNYAYINWGTTGDLPVAAAYNQ